MEDHAGGKNRDGESDGRLQPKLLLFSGQMTNRVSKKSIVSSGALFKCTIKRKVQHFCEISLSALEP